MPVIALEPVRILPELAVRLNDLAAPALPEASVIVPPAVSVMLVLPVELAFSVVAFVEAIEIPPVPATAVSDGVVRIPVELTPPATPAASRVSEPVAV